MSQFIETPDHLCNPALVKMAFQYRDAARQKRAFVAGGDPSAGGGGGGGGDPSAGGGDPSGGGGAPPSGGGTDPSAQIAQLQAQVQQMQQQQQMMQQGGGAGGAAGGAGALKPKIDEPSVMLSILKILARLADAQGVQIPASEMVQTQSNLQQLAAASQTGAPMPGMDPTAGSGSPAGGAGGAGGGAGGGIPPIGGVGDIQGGVKGGSDSRFSENGTPYKSTSTKLAHNGNWAGAIAALVRQRRSA